MTLMSGREIRLSSTEIRASSLHCFVLGLVALTSFVLTAIAFSYLVPYVVGIPLLAIYGPGASDPIKYDSYTPEMVRDAVAKAAGSTASAQPPAVPRS